MSRAGGIPGLKSGTNKDFPQACISSFLLSAPAVEPPGSRRPGLRCLNFSQPQFPCLKHVFTPSLCKGVADLVKFSDDTNPIPSTRGGLIPGSPTSPAERWKVKSCCLFVF